MRSGRIYPSSHKGKVQGKKMRILNYTPHTVSVKQQDGTYREIRSSGAARIQSRQDLDEIIDGIQFFTRKNDFVTGLPEMEEGTLYIVSSVVKMFLREREDLVTPTMVSHVLNRCEGFWR